MTMNESHHEQRESRSVIGFFAGFFALVLAVGLYTARPAGSEEVKEARKHRDKSVKEESGTYIFMIVYDGAEHGGADIFGCDE
jgi:hypothetical protein